MTGLLNRRTASHQILCGLLAALMAGGPSASIAQQSTDLSKPIEPPAVAAPESKDKTLLADPASQKDAKPAGNFAYTLPNACLIIVARPAQILSSPAAELYPTEVLQAAAIKEFGLDPLAAEQLIVSVAPPLGGPPSYALFAQFNKPVELKSSELTKHTQPATLKDKQYFQSQELMHPSFYPVTESSLLAAPDFTLQQMLSRDAPPALSPLAASVAAAAKGDDLLAIVDIEALRPLIHLGIEQAKLPPELESLRQVPDLVKQVELRVNFTGAGITELVATANDEAAAEQIVAIFDGVKQIFADKIAAETAKALQSDDPVEQAGARYSQRMTKYWDAQLQLVREGDRLVLLRHDLANDPTSQLTYIATIGILVALLLPAIQAAREAARRNVSMNNMKMIMLGLLNYESARGAFPAYANFDANERPLLSWRVHVLPHMDQQRLYEKFHLDEPWDSEHNKQLIPLMPEIFVDPSSGLPPADGKTHYVGVIGPDHFFDGSKEGRRIADIKDGTAVTVAIIQVGNKGAVTWTKPEDAAPDDENLLKNFEPLHPGGFWAAYCDGHREFFNYDIDPKVFKALLTVAGGETINAESH
jgi:hypothetical protein